MIRRQIDLWDDPEVLEEELLDEEDRRERQQAELEELRRYRTEEPGN